MYEVEIKTTFGNYNIVINDLNELQSFIDKYWKIYQGCTIRRTNGRKSVKNN